MAMSDGWTRLTFPRFVNPGLMSSLQSRMEHGTVREDGTVAVEDRAELDGEGLEQAGEDPVEPGTEVVITLRGGDPYCRPVSEQKREEREVKERHERKERARARLKDWKQRRAREFWNQYDIPVQWDVAIKGRRSGLSRGSWGDGRAANTVEHLFIQESFEDGRLKRDADTYLCDDSAELRFSEGERRQNSEGDTYIPPVTCSRCLDLMARWKRGDGDE